MGRRIDRLRLFVLTPSPNAFYGRMMLLGCLGVVWQEADPQLLFAEMVRIRAQLLSVGCGLFNLL
jgi:hypothetical protein